MGTKLCSDHINSYSLGLRQGRKEMPDKAKLMNWKRRKMLRQGLECVRGFLCHTY